MSNVVDERVVEMRFDNKQFESGVQTSMGTLQRLKDALNFNKSAQSLNQLTTAVNTNFSGMSGALQVIQDRFSTKLETRKHILFLRHIVNKTDAEIVLSSSWRNCGLLPKLCRILREYNLHISDITPYILDRASRGREIRAWLDDHTGVESFVILDDEDFDIVNMFPDNIVKTNSEVGLQKEDAEKCIAILSNIKSK